MKRTLLAPPALLLCGLPCLSLAQQPLPADPLPAAALAVEPLRVTASRTGNSPVSIASSSLISREQIERQQAGSVPELLQRLAGVSVTSNGGRGKNTAVSIRGSSDKQVLVLIDGLRVGSATSGSAALQNIPVEQIERIEIVRGPRSSLYGSEAMGGVIQIFTRRGGADGLKPYFALGAGSRSSYSGAAGVAGGQGNGWFNFGVASESTDGINARAYRASAPNAYEPDADGYRELSAQLRAGYRFASGLELDGSWLQSEHHSDFDGRTTRGSSGRDAYSDGSLQALSGRARFAPLAVWNVTLQAGHSEDLGDNFQDGAFYSRFDTRRDSLSWQNDFQVGEAQILTLGMDHQRDRIDSRDSYAEDSRYNRGYFVQYQAAFGRHGVQAGLRHDEDEFFGSHATGSLGYSFELSEALSLIAAYGSAYRAPTFNDLYYPASASSAGNPHVQPEESRSVELGLRGSHGWGEWSVNAYENQIDDLIVWAGSRPMRPENVEVARIRGIETSLASELAGWDVVANLTVMDPQDRSKANHGHLLPRRAKRQFNLDLDRRFGAVGLGASLQATSERFDKASNAEDTRMPGYALVDLRSEYHLDAAWRLQARLTNLFDRDYETTQTYQQPGRAVHFTLRYQAL